MAVVVERAGSAGGGWRRGRGRCCCRSRRRLAPRRGAPRHAAGGVVAFTVTVEDKKLPYWIRTRPFWPDLSELMLLWLKAPISTACVERGFSFMTIMDSNTPAHEGSEGRARSPAAAARAHPLPATVSLRRRRSCRRGPAGSRTTPSTDPRAPPPQETRADTGEVRVEMRSGARHHDVGGSHGQPGWFAFVGLIGTATLGTSWHPEYGFGCVESTVV